MQCAVIACVSAWPLASFKACSHYLLGILQHGAGFDRCDQDNPGRFHRRRSARFEQQGPTRSQLPDRGGLIVAAGQQTSVAVLGCRRRCLHYGCAGSRVCIMSVIERAHGVDVAHCPPWARQMPSSRPYSD